MGAYGGGGGFTPSPNNIPGPTKVGSIVADVHQMTGSVEIDGDLILNGSAITPGGGVAAGATTQIQYNNAGAFAGSANLTFDGSSLKATGSLYISSSAAGSNVPLLRIDHPGSGDDNPILFVTGSGFIGIGVPEPTYHLQVAASNEGAPGGTTRAFKVENETGGEWFSVNGGSISFGAQGGFAKWGGISLGQRFSIAPFNATYGALGIGKYPGSTANIVEVNSANTDLSGDFFVIDSDGKVGIGVTDPDSALEVFSTTTQQKWSYDADSFATLTVADGSTTTLASGESGNIVIDAAGLLQLEAPATTVSNEFVLTSPTVPAGAGALGVPGQISWENGFVYVCVAANTWQRAALSTF